MTGLTIYTLGKMLAALLLFAASAKFVSDAMKPVPVKAAQRSRGVPRVALALVTFGCAALTTMLTFTSA